jgi:hypothetical protein
MGFVTGIATATVTRNWILGFVQWTIASPLLYVSAGLVSYLRGKGFYRGNFLEEGARGETEVWVEDND